MTASSHGSAAASSFSSILASSNGTLHSLGTLQVKSFVAFIDLMPGITWGLLAKF